MLFETLESIPGFVDGKLTNKFGNWANDADCAPFVGCSFMDLHDDVGYDVDRQLLLTKNSFGPNWGDSGFCWLTFEYVKQQVFESWNFEIKLQ